MTASLAELKPPTVSIAKNTELKLLTLMGNAPPFIGNRKGAFATRRPNCRRGNEIYLNGSDTSLTSLGLKKLSCWVWDRDLVVATLIAHFADLILQPDL